MTTDKNAILTSRVLKRYPSSYLDKNNSSENFEKIWHEIEKFYKGDELELFKKFSSLVHGLLPDNFHSYRSPLQRYHELLSYFKSFMADMTKMDFMESGFPGAYMRVHEPPEHSFPVKDGHKAYMGITVHTTDSPFIFENMAGYLNLNGYHIFSSLHPVLTVKRENGRVIDVGPPEENGQKEVFIYFLINRIVEPESTEKLESEIWGVLESLFHSVGQFNDMTLEIDALRKEISGNKKMAEDAAETTEFLNWLVPNNYIFMGLARYEIASNGKGHLLKENEEKRFGVCRDRELMGTTFPGLMEEVEIKIINTLKRPYMMIFDFFNTASSIIYHKEPVDVIIVREYGKDGIPNAAVVLVGRLARGAMMSRASGIPFLDKKIRRIMDSEKIMPKSHMHREITTAFNYMPKRELFYIDRLSLAAVLNIFASIRSDDELHLLFRYNEEFEYMSAILVFSAKKYSASNYNKIKKYLKRSLGLEIVYDEVSQSPSVTQAFIYFKVERGTSLEFDSEKIGQDIKNLLTTWDQHVASKLVSILGDHDGLSLFNRYCPRITDLFRQAVTPTEAVSDILKLKEVEMTRSLQLDITIDSPTTATLRMYWNKELDLMKLIPTFRNLSLCVKEELALPLEGEGCDCLYVQLLKLEDSEERICLLDEAKDTLVEALQLIISGEAEDCSLNRLIISAGFDWRKVDLVRGYSSYLLQINSAVNPYSVREILNKYPQLLATAVAYFLEKFDPNIKDRSRMEEIKSGFNKGLGGITDLTEDSIMRLFFNIIENTLRTNYFKPKSSYYLSFKLDCPKISMMPKPVPFAEIYVHTPYLEGLHLRGGMVARGGLRWSDRPDDFRSEVLGLMKTQMIKNSVIVPVGSKGGFIIKKMKFSSREERDKIFKTLYQTFISGLLDLTDNFVEGEICPPNQVVSYDDPDPYLVVAADKGTATMSDSANEVSKQYHFWLGDAFASGGAIGYDHKKFGITARGAWECIKRHFRELNVDIQKESITVVGIGDMAGDVFGNGMLLSEMIKLVAAFNHIHIFLDPNPDHAKSFEERKRLFVTPGTTWMDYKSDLISEGGGVFLRSAKSIPLSEPMQKLLGVNKSEMSGNELIRAILTMPVDLLYSGGIGTYLRASTENNIEVGDKANDPVRVSANKVRARVIGEGANLSLTQKARIEFAVGGGILNTDSIDNSAGVDISDHEVNLKILLEIMLDKNELKSASERNKFFTKLGPEIVDLVLKDNYLQSAGVTLDQRRSSSRLELFLDLVDDMSAKGLLDREDEDIPSREELSLYAEKPGHLPRPILAVLYGYEKNRITNEIMKSPIVDLAFSERYLYKYFPEVIHRDFSQSLNMHRLKKEIIATMVSNKIINQAGISLIFELERSTGFPAWEICRAYLIIENLLEADDYRQMVHDEDNSLNAQMQINFLLKMEGLMVKVVTWMLKHMPEDRISFDFINQYREIVKRFKENLIEKLETICSMETGCIDQKVDELAKDNVPPELARWIVILPYLKDIMAIVSVKEQRHTEFIETGNLYIAVTTAFEIDWISYALESYPAETTWESRTVDNLLRELEVHQSQLVMKILDFKRKGEKIDTAFTNYIKEKESSMTSYRETVQKIKEEKSSDLLAIGVLIRNLSEFD